MRAHMHKPEEAVKITSKEVVILEESQHAYIGGNTHNQEPLSPRARRVLYKYACEVVNNYSAEKYNYEHGYKHHVEVTAGNQQVQPPVLMRQQKVQECNYGEKQ
jgi:hypothetical protein